MSKLIGIVRRLLIM